MVTLVTAHVYLQGHDFNTFGVSSENAMSRLFQVVQHWFEYNGILNVSRNTIEKLKELTDFDTIYDGLAIVDQSHV
jgi:hypothetical protein